MTAWLSRLGRHLAIVVFIGIAAAAASGAVKTYPLPADCADFAMNSDNGDLAAVIPDKNEAILIKAADWQKGKVDAFAKLSVGSTPVSIFYKRYQNVRVYAIVCTQDSHMYLMNAADGTLLKKIELAHSGVSNVTGSINPEDPFVYYNYGGGHDSMTGAVSLKSFQSHAQVFNDSMDCAISASGEVAYRRGPWSPSGFESLIRTSAPGDEKPAFARLFYDHNSTAQYVPDPFDRYTAAGKTMYAQPGEAPGRPRFRAAMLFPQATGDRRHAVEQ